MDKYCVSCHDAEGSSGSPMPLLTYEDMVADAVLTDGKKVYETVGTRVHDTKRPMPPKQKLTAAELAIIDEFVAAKAPEGDDPTCGGGDKNSEGERDRHHGAHRGVAAKGVRRDLQDPLARPGRSHRSDAGPRGPGGSPAGRWSTRRGATRRCRRSRSTRSRTTRRCSTTGSCTPGGAFLTGWAPGDDERPPSRRTSAWTCRPASGSLQARHALLQHRGHAGRAGPERRRASASSRVSTCARTRPPSPWASRASATVRAGPGRREDGPQSPAPATSATTAPVHLMTASPHAHKYARHMKFTVTKKDKARDRHARQPFAFGEQGTYPLEPRGRPRDAATSSPRPAATPTTPARTSRSARAPTTRCASTSPRTGPRARCLAAAAARAASAASAASAVSAVSAAARAGSGASSRAAETSHARRAERRAGSLFCDGANVARVDANYAPVGRDRAARE